MAGKTGKLPAAEVIGGECLAVRVRTLNRAVTALVARSATATP